MMKNKTINVLIRILVVMLSASIYAFFFKVIVEEIFDHIDIPVKLKSVKRSLFYR